MPELAPEEAREHEQRQLELGQARLGHRVQHDEHAAVDEGGGVERAGKGRGAVDDGLRPGHRVDVQDPQVTQSEGRNVEMLTQHRSTNYKLAGWGSILDTVAKDTEDTGVSVSLSLS